MLRSRFSMGLVILITAVTASCPDEEFTRLAPKIQVDVCAAPDYISDCWLDFGLVDISRQRPLDVLIKNPTAIDLVLTKIELSQDTDPAFTLPIDLPTVVTPPAAGCENDTSQKCGQPLTITFKPTVESVVRGKVLIYSDAVNITAGEPLVVELVGSGRYLGEPDISIDPPQCAFGDVGAGATVYCDLSVVNRGQLDLVINSVSGDGDFSATDLSAVFRPASVLPVPVSLPSQAGVTVRISATPPDTSAYSGNLYFDSNDPDTPRATVPLSVQGAAVPTAVARIYSVNNALVAPGDAPTVAPLDDVIITGEDSQPGTAGRTITGYQWTLETRPADSTVELTAPTSARTGFTFNSSGIDRPGLDVVGTYVVRLVAIDNQGSRSTNDARVTLNAMPGEAIHVQLTWDHATADIDLHFIRNSGSMFTADDCYFGNCDVAGGLNWGGGGANPHLDVDDTDGYGPENINVDQPNNGIYLIAVHYWSPHANTVPTYVNVKVFIQGGLRSDYIQQLTLCNQWWEVARVEWPSGLVTPAGDISMISRGSCY
ncbi:MAG: hypothetical protein JXR83_10090 [Deltaproteobacteria bacterium]|nr:hypothetical protein [Deltaproteobacteria bacterium]